MRQLFSLTIAMLAIFHASLLTTATMAAAVSPQLPPLCSNIDFEEDAFVACTVDPQRYAIRLHLDDASGRPYGSLTNFARLGPSVLFSMNAGMYLRDLHPQGLFIEDGRTISQINTATGEGNFYMMPNGVLIIGQSGATRVVPGQSFTPTHDIAFATQSGPMLVIDGALHPAFSENGTSHYVRNGVGVREDGVVVFALSRDEVSFGRFARLFRDALHCPNALYLDGFVSALANDNEVVVGGNYQAGPIVSVTPR
jgi:uncharacterized protein YigE (DUF2233 family)